MQTLLKRRVNNKINKMNTTILKSFGLNKNDIIIYETLLKIGRSKTGPIINNSQIASSRVYESLRILVSRGLVSYFVKNNIKYYQAEPPRELITETDKNMQALKSLVEEISTLPPANPLSRNEVNVYTGKHGFKMAFTQHVEKMKKGEKICIIGFSKRAYTGAKEARELRSFFVNMDKFIIPKKIDTRLLSMRDLSDTLKKERDKPSIYNIRYLPDGYFGPCAVNISEKEVLISIWGESPLVFSIRNPIMIKSFQKNFEFLWSIAKNK